MKRWPFPAAAHLTAKQDPREEAQDRADDAKFDPPDEPYCVCDTEPTAEECDRRRCSACGKVLIS